MRNYVASSAALILMFLSLVINAQNIIDQSSKSSVRRGRLENGFTYFLISNPNFGDDVLMTLVVNAGYHQEDSSQLGLAHLLEHQAFIETKHFLNPKAYFSQKGLRFGADFNASTKNNSTNYVVKFADTNHTLFSNALIFLSDCSQGIILHPDKVQQEKGVVINEILSKRGYENEMLEDFNRQLIEEKIRRSQLSEVNNVAHSDFSQVVRFYNDWYQPSLQGLIIVGNIDLDQTEQQVINQFNSLRQTSPNKSKLFPKIFERYPLKRVIAIGHEKQPNIQLTIDMFQDVKPNVSKFGLKNSVLADLCETLTNFRSYSLKQLGSLVNSNFGITFRHFQGRYAISGLSTLIELDSNDAISSYKNSIAEIERLRRYGFTELELQRAKKEVLSKYTNSFSLTEIAEMYTDRFVYGLSTEGVTGELSMLKNIAASSSLSEVNKFFRKWFWDAKYNITLKYPISLAKKLPLKQHFTEILNTASIMPLDHYQGAKIPKTLLKKANSPGKAGILRQKTDFQSQGLKKVSYSNGLQVLLKQLPLLKDSLLTITLVKRVGYEMFADSLRYGLANVSTAMDSVGPLKVKQFELLLMTNNIQPIYPNVLKDFSVITGSASTDQLEILLQTFYLFLKQSKISEKILASLPKRQAEHSNSSANNSQFVFYDSIGCYLRDHFDLAEPQQLIPGNMDRNVLQNLYEEIFSIDSNSCLLVIGKFDVPETLTLISKYLGSLPGNENSSSGNNEVRRNFDCQQGVSPQKQENKTDNVRVFHGSQVDSVAFINFTYKAGLSCTPPENDILWLITDIIQERLRKKLREEMGDVYHVGCYLKRETRLRSYSISIDFKCPLKKYAAIIDSCKAELLLLSRGIFDEHIFEGSIQRLHAIHTKEVLKIDFWNAYLMDQFLRVQNNCSVDNYNSDYINITFRDIQLALRNYLQVNKLFTFVMLP